MLAARGAIGWRYRPRVISLADSPKAKGSPHEAPLCVGYAYRAMGVVVRAHEAVSLAGVLCRARGTRRTGW